jgi:hypothetical protein
MAHAEETEPEFSSVYFVCSVGQRILGFGSRSSGQAAPDHRIQSLFTEGQEGNEESHDHLMLFVPSVIFCSIPSRAFPSRFLRRKLCLWAW